MLRDALAAIGMAAVIVGLVMIVTGVRDRGAHDLEN